MESTVVLAIIGLASALIAILGKILKDLVDVVKSNTEVNGSVAIHMQSLSSSLAEHRENVGQFFNSATPALNQQSEIIEMVKHNTDVFATISESNSKITQALVEVSKSQKDILTLVTNNKRRPSMPGGRRSTDT